MPNIIYAEQELRYAQEAINTYAQTHKFNDKDWLDFLLHLDLCFIKAERGCQDVKNLFQPFQGSYINLRKKDPLLSYLKNARDAISHDATINICSEIFDENLFEYTTIGIGNTEEGWMEHKVVKAYPTVIKLQPFKINGKTWQPPKEHLEVAMLGIKFYDGFLKEIRRKFIDKK